MKRAIHCSDRVGRSGARWSTARLVAAGMLVANVATFVACADSEVATGVVVEDTELVGMWQGPMRGPWGDSVMTLRLHADSTMTLDNENNHYSHLDGVWTISDGRFVATGTPGYGVVVTLVASPPFVHLAGTWTTKASSGSFDLAKR